MGTLEQSRLFAARTASSSTIDASPRESVRVLTSSNREQTSASMSGSWERAMGIPRRCLSCEAAMRTAEADVKPSITESDRKATITSRRSAAITRWSKPTSRERSSTAWM